jgi:hypothetical protein
MLFTKIFYETHSLAFCEYAESPTITGLAVFRSKSEVGHA